ncbi:Anti-sigma-V factor RsiV [compost metagenome]
MTLKDLFKEGYNYKDIINKEIGNQIQKNKENYFTDKNGFKGISDNQAFTFNDKEITIYFQQYEIAPYVTGIPTFNIPKSLLKDGLI